MSQLFASGGQGIRASVSASVLSMNIQDWFPLGIDWFDFLAVQGTLKSTPAPQFKSINNSVLSFLMAQLSHPYMTIGKTKQNKNKKTT